ncbi:hypothetical protein ACIRLA_46605 [Streptomyces sp. NPDC102364]|uniref:hypothetical protein n=1 Tax=Streptomyces sp. NPDC102364 TaxID=3366161 RepID=UPI00382007D4
MTRMTLQLAVSFDSGPQVTGNVAHLDFDPSTTSGAELLVSIADLLHETADVLTQQEPNKDQHT